MSVVSSSSWTSFLKSIASYNGDLSSLTAPPFILSHQSLTEFTMYWAEHPELLVEPNFITADEGAPAEELDAMAFKRVIAVTRWFIATLRSQYCSRNEKLGSEKKQLNPFLGELFVGKWDDRSDGKLGETTLVTEQVSHHPPVTAFNINNAKNNTNLQGYFRVGATVSATSINVKQYGHSVLEFKDLNETYLVTLAPLHIEGLISASPFVELEGTSYIQASNGYFVSIDYTGKGYFSGKKHTFKARIFRDQLSSASKENALVTIAGQWDDKSYITKGHTTPTKSDELFYDAKATQPQHLTVKPVDEQHPLESRKAWEKVAAAIKSENYSQINVEKSLIENNQREMRKTEAASGSQWETRWFDLVDYEDEAAHQGDPFVSLTNLSNLSIRSGPSGSLKKSKYDTGDSKHWRFSLKKWANELEVKI